MLNKNKGLNTKKTNINHTFIIHIPYRILVGHRITYNKQERELKNKRLIVRKEGRLGYARCTEKA
jgi:hypothetical protein